MATARKLLGKDAIIGVSANTIEEAEAAARGGADYLGIGALYSTQTKNNIKNIMGTSGAQKILEHLVANDLDVKTVCIGGINAATAQRTIYQSATPSKSFDGIAVVSAIIAAEDPRAVASHLRHLVATPPPFATSTTTAPLSRADILSRVPALVKRLAEKKPLCHNMTNLVVQNFAANVALAVGASPIMSNNSLEAADLAALGGALVINMGTTTPGIREEHLRALAAYNAVGGPTLLDPVGAGATEQRRQGVKALLAAGYFDVIKGNEGEIRTVSGASGVKQHGVDSGASNLSIDQRARLVKQIAARERNIVLMTGSTDVVSDGRRTFTIENGHEFLGDITGSGCTLGTTIASFLAVEREDKLLATVAGILMYEIAAERAAQKPAVNGPGTFVPAFIDELYAIRQESSKGQNEWIQAAKIQEA